MSAPFSTSSLGNVAQLRLGAQQARIGISALDGLGAQPDSFSRTLENRMNTPEPAPRKPESVPAAPRQPERAASAEPAREPARAADNGSATGPDTGAGARAQADAEEGSASAASASGTSASSAERTDTRAGGEGAASNAAAAATAPPGASDAAAAAGDAQAVASQAGHAARLAALAAGTAADAEETPADATASSPTDPAALAGLPAAIAALLAGRVQAPSPADQAGAETSTLQLAADGGRKSLQNSALLPKTDLSAGTGGNTGPGSDATPAFLLQGREFAAAAMAARGASGAAAGGMTADGLEPAGTGSANGNAPAGLPHTHGATQLLRQSPAAQAASPQLPVATPAGEPGWAEDVGNQVRWMLGRAESKAELVLTPPNMGKLEVSINLAGDQTTAQFIASSQAARDAIERALPQLREALQQAGILLGDANVSTSGQGREGDGREGGGDRGDRGEASAGGNTGTGSAGGWLRQQQGMVDTFA
ncbi:flagellar hook-length control protein FliK [Thauera phenylacetica]